MAITRNFAWDGRRLGPVPAAAAAVLLAPIIGFAAALQQSADPPRTGREVYLSACAACHGPDGRGQSQSRVGFAVPLPDFTDCDFAAREPDGDWLAVAHLGGPARGFDEMMPAFGEALTDEELEAAVAHVRTFCRDEAWPRGELNLPRPHVTGKAFLEDEAVFAATIDEGGDAIRGKFVYEQRFGPRNMWEIVVPFGWAERAPAAGPGPGPGWTASFGDVALAVKRAFYHSARSGTILSGAAELILPTGDEETGFGKGTFVLEPFLAYGQILPSDFFLQAQAGLELPFDGAKAESEGFLRLALGRGFSSGRWGRSWAPMVELLASRAFESGAKIGLDVLPQLQVSLNTRQHILFNVGVRLPVTDAAARKWQLLVYVLWDWFDGGFFEGW